MPPHRQVLWGHDFRRHAVMIKGQIIESALTFRENCDAVRGSFICRSSPPFPHRRDLMTLFFRAIGPSRLRSVGRIRARGGRRWHTASGTEDKQSLARCELELKFPDQFCCETYVKLLLRPDFTHQTDFETDRSRRWLLDAVVLSFH